jgi:acyloxyacyl hydrolase
VISPLPQPPRPRLNRLKQLFLQDVNGGTTCATCIVLVGLAEQLGEVYNVSIAEASSGQDASLLVDVFAPQIIELVVNEATPDIVCHGLNFCRNDTGQFCHIFPLPKYSSEHELHLKVLQVKKISQSSTKTSPIIPLE